MEHKLQYTFNDMKIDLVTITRNMALDKYSPDIILGPGRGGYTLGVMLSHYFAVPFYGFHWQTRDGNDQDVTNLGYVLSKYVMSSHGVKNVLIVDDINDTGKTLTKVIEVTKTTIDLNSEKTNKEVAVCTLFNKETSKFQDVKYYAKTLTMDYDPWIIFPYEEWWKQQ